MSGNFDFPPASRPPAAVARGGRHLLHQRLREFNTLRAEIEAYTPPSAQHGAHAEPRPLPLPTSRRPFTARIRRRGGGYLRTESPTAALSMDDFDGSRPGADSFLGEYNPPPLPYYMGPLGPHEFGGRECPGGMADINRRRKRRKIDHDDPLVNGGMNGFRYGHRGSVVPGPLRMEIEHCDGGVIPALSMHNQLYAPNNVLRNNRSVYCTHHTQCNLILAHLGQTSFTLTKMVIKAPASGFTAPIQEGLVFVSMELNQLQTGTFHYTIRYPSPKSQAAGSTSTDANNRPLSRRRDSSARRVPPPISDDQPRSTIRPSSLDLVHDNPGRNSFHADLAPASLPPNAIRPPPAPALNVTMHCDPPSSDESEPDSPRTLEDRARRDIDPPPYDHDTSEDDDNELREAEQESAPFATRARMMREARQTRGRRRVAPSVIESTVFRNSASSGSSDGGNGNPGQEGGDKAGPSQEADTADSKSLQAGLLTPVARFFIERDRSVVSINFDPPIAGKFILLKLYSPFADTNIDIQSIIAYGFAGPRYFSAEEML